MTLLGKRRLLQFWIKGLYVSDCFRAFPFRWSKKEKKFILKTKKEHQIFLIRLFIAAIYWLISLIQIYITWDLTSTYVAAHSILFATTYFLTLTCHYVNWTERHAVIGLYNNLANYERAEYADMDLDDDVQRKYDILTKVVLFMQTQTSITMPPLYQIDMARNPCFPVNGLYWLCKRCRKEELGIAHPIDWDVQEVAATAFIQFISYTNWMFVITPYTYNIAYELVLHGHCFRSYIHQYGEKMMEFAEFDKATELHCKAFRKIQILLGFYRDIYSKSMIGIIIGGVVVLEVIFLYNAIEMTKSGAEGSMGMYILNIWCTIMGAFILIFIFGSLADVYTFSQGVSDSIRTKTNLMRNKWFRRFHRSCPTLKIHFGQSNNYLDELTPLNLMEFTIDQTVSLLLL